MTGGVLSSLVLPRGSLPFWLTCCGFLLIYCRRQIMQPTSQHAARAKRPHPSSDIPTAGTWCVDDVYIFVSKRPGCNPKQTLCLGRTYGSLFSAQFDILVCAYAFLNEKAALHTIRISVSSPDPSLPVNTHRCVRYEYSTAAVAAAKRIPICRHHEDLSDPDPIRTAQQRSQHPWAHAHSCGLMFHPHCSPTHLPPTP